MLHSRTKLITALASLAIGLGLVIPAQAQQQDWQRALNDVLRGLQNGQNQGGNQGGTGPRGYRSGPGFNNGIDLGGGGGGGSFNPNNGGYYPNNGGYYPNNGGYYPNNSGYYNGGSYYNNNGYYNNGYSNSAPPPPAPNYSYQPIVITCPANYTGQINYRLNEFDYSMTPGQAQTFKEDRRWEVSYDPGNGGAPARYRLTPGNYEFRQVNGGGWQIFKVN